MPTYSIARKKWPTDTSNHTLWSITSLQISTSIRWFNIDSALDQLWIEWVESELKQLRKSMIFFSQNRVSLEKLKVELSQSWVAQIAIWIILEPVRKNWVKHNSGFKSFIPENLYKRMKRPPNWLLTSGSPAVGAVPETIRRFLLHLTPLGPPPVWSHSHRRHRRPRLLLPGAAGAVKGHNGALVSRAEPPPLSGFAQFRRSGPEPEPEPSGSRGRHQHCRPTFRHHRLPTALRAETTRRRAEHHRSQISRLFPIGQPAQKWESTRALTGR